MANELKKPRASPAKVAYHLERLRKLFARASDRPFLQMVWGVGALYSERAEAAATVLAFPPEAADQFPYSRFAVHPWELETLLIRRFLTPRMFFARTSSSHRFVARP